ncbi:MAG: nuclear transport factor 2 family protein [Chthoniobacterales bacterium]
MMKRILAALLVLTFASAVHAETEPEAPVLTKLLNEFLAGAGRNDAEIHERFWADDLIYTTSKGERKDKAAIMKEVRSEAPAKAGDEATVFSAENIRIQEYGETAIVAFRLVGSTEKDGKKTVQKYFNTGTFLKRNGQWQAVAWQATMIPAKAKPKP